MTKKSETQAADEAALAADLRRGASGTAEPPPAPNVGSAPKADPAPNVANIADMKKGEVAAKRPQDVVNDLLMRSKSVIVQTLPKHMTPDRLLRIALTAINSTPQLRECYPPTLVGAVIQAASLGLEPNTIQGHAYLVPFWNNKKRRLDVQLIPGYKGLVDLARRTGIVSRIAAHVVYANDVFEHELGAEEKLIHRPKIEGERGIPIAAYAVAHFKDGDGWQCEVMRADEIEDIKRRSKSRNKNGDLVGPWVDNEMQMWRKTTIRRLFNYLPSSVEVQRALALDDRAATGRDQHLEAVLHGDLDAPLVDGGDDSIIEGETVKEGSHEQGQNSAA